MRTYLLKRGRTRLQVLYLLLKLEKGSWILVSKLKQEYQESFKQKLEDWYMYILHRDVIIEFKNTRVGDWKKSGSPKSGVYIIHNCLRKFNSDYLRIIPSKYDSLKKEKALIKEKIHFST